MTIFQAPFHQNHPVGEQTFTSSGTFSVPTDVYYISAVVVGAGGGGGDGGSTAPTPGGAGGGLAWVSNLPVSPGENLTITVGLGGLGGAGSGSAGLSRIARDATNLVTANGGANGSNTEGASGGAGGTIAFDASITGVGGIGTGGGSGGAGGNSVTNASCGGGGGAGGYSGVGGKGGDSGGAAATVAGTSGSGGGGGGGATSPTNQNDLADGGGGVQLLGQGNNGTSTTTLGGGGSGGSSGSIVSGDGGLYGGGAGGSTGNAAPADGANGAVRIVWGQNRFFPTTNVDRKVEFLTSVTTSTSTIEIPSDAQEGDIAVLMDLGYSGAGVLTIPTTTVPTNWISIANGSQGATAPGMRAICSYEILTASDPGTTITGINTTNMRKTMVIFRPNFTVTSITLSTPGNSVTAADPAAQTISLTSVSNPVVGIAHMGCNNAVSTRSVTGGAMSEITNTTNQYVQYEADNTVDISQNATVDIADGGINALQSFYFTFTGFPYG